MAVAAVRKLAAAAPNGLWIIAHPLVAPIWRRLHRADRVITAQKGLAGTWQVARALRKLRIGQAYVLAGSTRAAMIPWLAGIPKRAGYDQDLKRYFLTAQPPLPGEGLLHKSLDYYALIHGSDALAALGVPDRHKRLPSQLSVPFSQPATAQSGEQARDESRGGEEQGNTIALIPGAARGPAKRWPVEHFTALAGLLLAASEHSRIEVLGAKDDQPLGAAIYAGNKAHGGRIVDRTGQTSIEAWLDAIAASTLVICNDSGGMHVADGFGRPLIALFGTTDPSKTGPSSPQSVAMQKSHFAHEEVARDSKESQQALAAITPSEVFRQCEKMLPWLRT